MMEVKQKHKGEIDMSSMPKPPRRQSPAPDRAVLIAGTVMLITLLGMSLGTALLPAAAQVQNGLLAAGGLLLLLGSELWLLHVLRGAAPAEPPHLGHRGRRDK